MLTGGNEPLLGGLDYTRVIVLLDVYVKTNLCLKKISHLFYKTSGIPNSGMEIRFKLSHLLGLDIFEGS